MRPSHERGRRHHFEGLAKPPGVRSDQPGTVFFLRASTLGRLNRGSPVSLHDVNVGEVLSYELLVKEHEVRKMKLPGLCRLINVLPC